MKLSERFANAVAMTTLATFGGSLGLGLIGFASGVVMTEMGNYGSLLQTVGETLMSFGGYSLGTAAAVGAAAIAGTAGYFAFRGLKEVASVAFEGTGKAIGLASEAANEGVKAASEKIQSIIPEPAPEPAPVWGRQSLPQPS